MLCAALDTGRKAISCIIKERLLLSKRLLVSCSLCTSRLSTTNSDTSVQTLAVSTASSTAYRGPCVISGWIKSAKHQSKHSFLHLTDGLSGRHLQVVIPANRRGDVSDYKPGASVKVTGDLADSPGMGQSMEVQATEIQLLGNIDQETYPLSNTKKHNNADYVRQYPHLRSKKAEFSAMLRLRSACRRAINDYFLDNGYIQIDTPIITSNDCEGAGETFSVAASDDTRQAYFGKGKDVKLTVSGQLHLETANSGISKVYTFGPTFRADHAVSRNHLAEFYMVEGEIAFIDGLEDLLTCVEDFTKSVTNTIVENNQEDISALYQASTRFEPTDLSRYLSNPFQRITYTDAIHLLQSATQQFEMLPQFGDDLHKEHELYILQAHDYLPVFITDWPRKLKPFYMYVNDDEQTVSCMDLIVPGPGELFGGSVREHRYERLEKTLTDNDVLKDFNWYLDLRRFGSAPHAGFGMGFERFLQFLFGIKHIRDTLPFPRYENSCKL